MALIGGKKLVRVSPDLYSEPYKDGKDFKWEKHPERLNMDVYNLSRRIYSSVDDPRSSGLVDAYKEERREALEGIGIFEDRSVHFIDEDGAIGPSIERIEFCIRPYKPGEGEELPASSMWWRDEEEVRWSGRRDPHLFMEVLVSPQIYGGIVSDVEKRMYESITMGVFVEVFQSEVERGLAEPWMRQDYCIVEGSMAKVYFEHFSVTNPATSPNSKPIPKDDLEYLDDEVDWNGPAKLAEPIEEIRDLFLEYAKNSVLLMHQTRGVKIALWCVVIVLIIMLFVLAD